MEIHSLETSDDLIRSSSLKRLLLIKDDRLRLSGWNMGVVIKTYPDPNGDVRVADVKSRLGIKRRSITKLVLLLKPVLTHIEVGVGSKEELMRGLSPFQNVKVNPLRNARTEFLISK